jgi:hypothetical protein
MNNSTNQYSVRRTTEDDYDMLLEWWDQWGFDKGGPPKDFLPNNGKDGVMVEVNGKPSACLFFYVTNSSIIQLAWPLSSKECRKEVRKEAMNLLIESAEQICKNQGANWIFWWGNNQSFTKRLIDYGFHKAESGFNAIQKRI